jgi:hypothetical protein
MALTKVCHISGADASFYLHELSEATMMKGLVKSGITKLEDSWNIAHPAALQKYGHSPFSLFAPDVIKVCPQVFNDNWRKFLGYAVTTLSWSAGASRFRVWLDEASGAGYELLHLPAKTIPRPRGCKSKAPDRSRSVCSLWSDSIVRTAGTALRRCREQQPGG